LAKPGSVTPHTKFEGEVYVLKKGEGGRHTRFSQLPTAVLYAHDGRDGTVALPEGTKMVMPGDNTKMFIELITPWRSRSNSVSPSAKAAAPSAPESSPRSYNKRCRQSSGRRVAAPGEESRVWRANGRRYQDSDSTESLRSPALDKSASDIVETAKRTGARVAGRSAATHIARYTVLRAPTWTRSRASSSRSELTSACRILEQATTLDA